MPKKEVKIVDFSLLWKKALGELDEAEDHFFEEWLNESPEHRLYFEKIQAYYNGDTPLKPFDQKQGWMDIKSKISARKKAPHAKYVRLAVAASLAVFVGISIWFFNLESDKKNELAATNLELIDPGKAMATLSISSGKTYQLEEGSKVKIVSSSVMTSDGNSLAYQSETEVEKATELIHTLETPRGGEFNVQLSDGTRVWLNAQSKLEYPEVFADDLRYVTVTGEAYFEVSKESRPFVVSSGDQEIEVLGTSFNVTAYPDDEALVTTLIEGKVEVRNRVGNEAQYLNPNEQSHFERYSHSITKKEVDPYQYIAWKNKSFYFEDRSMKEIMKILSRWYDVDVFFENSEASAERFSGEFMRYESFDEIGKRLEMTNELQIEYKNNAIIIR